MKLFWCDKCKRHYSTAQASVEFSHVISMSQEGEYFLQGDNDSIPYGVSILAKNPKCEECESYLHIVTIEKEKCEHDWNVFKTIRRCRLCGVEEKGKIVWE